MAEDEASKVDMEPDSLLICNDKGVEAEIVQAFENEDIFDQEVPQTPSLMSASRASVDSQRSVSFFVDLNDEALMAQSVTSRPISGRRTRSQMGDRLTQSMYVRSDSQSSGVSFFVDFSDKDKEAAEKSKKMVHSMSREEADHALDELSEDMRLKSSLLLAQNLEQTKAFFKKLKGYVDFLSLPSYSKDELRQKRKMAENISRLMFEEEQKLKKGQSLSSMGELDKILLGSHSGLLSRTRPKSAYCGSVATLSVNNDPLLENNPEEAEKPILRRERTFDLDPKPNQAKKIVEVVNIDIEDNSHNNDLEQNNGIDESSADGQTLQMFQQQRLYHTMRLKREIAKLERMEKDIAQKASEIGDIAMKASGTQTSRASSSYGQYGVPSVPATRPNGVPKTTTFRDMNQGRHRLRLSMTSNESSSSGQSTPRRPSTSSGLVNAASRPNSAQKSRGSQTNHSLFRNYYEKKDKAVYCRDRPQAFFIECDKAKTRPRSAIELGKTKIIDLETESLPDDQNLQEALRRKRPDYIEKTRNREQNIAKNSVKTTTPKPIKSSIPQATSIYASNSKNNSKIPTFRPKNASTNPTKKLINSRPVKAVH